MATKFYRCRHCGNVIHKVVDSKVQVGSVPHPMTQEHFIAFIYVETENGGILVNLKDKPEAEVCVCCSRPVAVYEYCNLHGLWKLDL